MKTIAVLTDFSNRAENAANYALRLAQSLHTNLILYDAFTVPSDSPLAAQIAWPLVDYNQLHEETENDLQLLTAKLKKQSALRKPGAFQPAISCQCHDGELAAGMGELLANRDVVMLVMASHDKSIATLLLSDHVRDLLDKTTLPLLIIRDHYDFQKIGNIALATDLDLTDIDVIHSLASLARPTEARITLIHIGPAGAGENDVKNFMDAVTARIDYPHIYYRKMVSSHIMDEMIGLDNNNTYHMLVMVHRHKGFWEELFNQSDTQKMATQINLPLLVYPFPTKSLPVF